MRLAPNDPGFSPQNTHRPSQLASTFRANTCCPTLAAASRIRSVCCSVQVPSRRHRDLKRCFLGDYDRFRELVHEIRPCFSSAMTRLVVAPPLVGLPGWPGRLVAMSAVLRAALLALRKSGPRPSTG